MPDEPIEPRPAETPAPPPVQPAYDFSQPPAPTQGPGTVQNDALGHLIPTKNPKALTAYYCGIFSLIPCVTTLALAPAAIFLGIQGLKAVKETPGLPGKAHAIVGIVLGSIMLLLFIAVFVIVLVFGRSDASRP
jgi:hypothetical protein